MNNIVPIIPICFWCAKEKNQIDLFKLKKNKKSEHIPRSLIIDYEPCDNCKLNMEKGITFIEATQTPNFEHQTEIMNNTYPTGRWWVVSEDGVKNMIGDAKIFKQILMWRKCYIDPDVAAKAFSTGEQNHDKAPSS